MDDVLGILRQHRVIDPKNSSPVDNNTSGTASITYNNDITPPLFEDEASSTAATLGSLHLANDKTIQNLVDAIPGRHISLIRSLASDLATRDQQIGDLRTQTAERERFFKKLLLDLGISSLEVERKLAEEEKRRKAENLQVQTVDNRIKMAMEEALSVEHRQQVNNLSSSKNSKHNKTHKSSQSVLSFDSGKTSNTKSSSQRKRGSSFFSWWTAPVPNNGTSSTSNDTISGSPTATPTQFSARSTTPRPSKSNHPASRRPISQYPSRPSSVRTESSSTSRISLLRNGSSRSIQSIFRYPTSSKAPSINSNDDRAGESSADETNDSISHPNIERMRETMVKNISSFMPSQSPKIDPSDGQIGSHQRVLSNPMVLPSTAVRNPSQVEMNAIIPEDEQPPSLWTQNINGKKQQEPVVKKDGSKVLTDRYGFIYDSKRYKKQTHKRASSDTDVEPTNGISRSSLEMSIESLDRSTSLPPKNDVTNGLTSRDSFISPTPPSISSTTVMSSKVIPPPTISRTSSTSVRMLLGQLTDLHDAVQKQQREHWDTFLNKIRLEEREGKDREDLVGFAGLGVAGKQGKSRYKEFRQLVLGGIPVAYRSKIWGECLNIGSLKVPGYYDEMLSNTATDPLVVMQIEMDVHRTIANNVFFGGSGPGVAKLQRVLIAFSSHNPEIGYCQGLNVITATLLLTHQTEEDAFWVLVAIVENVLPSGYFSPPLITSRADQRVLKRLVREHYPKIHKHMKKLGVDLEAITFNWFLSIFTDCLPAEVLFRVWDVFFVDRDVFLFRVALAIIKLNEKAILSCRSSSSVYSLMKEMLTTNSFNIDTLIKLSAEKLKQTIHNEDVLRMREESIKELQRMMDEGILDSSE